ncbi:hypothetical protein JW935_22765 [candidate division KSB1 bacterium]|nr:hypothetical protein [candidate division KSB1 bacterium]
MKIRDAFRQGVSLVVQNYKMIIVIYAVNIALVLAIAIPMFVSLNEEIGKMGIRDEITESIHVEWWTEFQFSAEGIQQTIRPALGSGFGMIFENLELILTGRFNTYGVWIFVFGLCYLFLAAFLNGGAIGLFSDEKKNYTTSRFFSNSAFYYHHFFAIALTVLLLYTLIYKLFCGGLWGLLKGAGGSSAAMSNISHYAGFAIILLVIIFFNMVMDYTKIIVVNEKKESSWLCIWLSIVFIFKNFLKSWGLYFLLSGVSIALILAAGILISTLNSQSVILSILVILLGQVYIILKIGLRLVFYSAQTTFYQHQHSQAYKKRKIKV